MKRTIPDSVNLVIDGSDIVLCILDARFIEETRNYETERKIKEQNKKIIYVINKADLAGHIEQKELNKLYPNVVISCTTRRGVSELRNKIKIIAKQIKKEKDANMFIGVVGYPNTGKSSVINLIIGRKEVAKTSSVSGFTKGIQTLKVSDKLYLLDSPGIIPGDERFTELTKLATIGVKTYDRAEDPDLIVHELMKQHPGIFEKFYKIDAEGDSEKLIELLGRKRLVLGKGGIVDVDKVSRMILRDWQKSKIRPVRV
jgi:hypothetical protein